MVTVSLLSMHAEDEQTLNEKNSLILVSCAWPAARLRQPPGRPGLLGGTSRVTWQRER